MIQSFPAITIVSLFIEIRLTKKEPDGSFLLLFLKAE